MRNLVRNITLYLLLLSSVSLATVSLVKRPQKELTASSIENLKTLVVKDGFEDLLDNNFSTSIFFYTSDSENRVLFTSVKEPNLIEDYRIINSDSFLSLNRRTHEAEECFVEYTNQLPSDSLFYQRLQKQGKISEEIAYASCPIIINDLLIGYVSSIIELNGERIYPYFNKLKVLTSEIETLLKPYF